MEDTEEPEAERVAKKIPMKKTSLSLFFTLGIPAGGMAGAGDGAPAYTEAYGMGIGAMGAIGYRIFPALEGRFGVGFMQFSPSSFELDTVVGPETNELTSYLVYWLTVSPRFYFLIDRPWTKWLDADSDQGFDGFCPYAGLRLGLTITGSVDWPTPPPEWPYWDSGATFYFEVYAGAEYRIMNVIGAFAEIGMTVLGPPNAASLEPPNSGMNEAGSLTALRISLGILVAL
jgi:hypothetical protein